MTRIHLMFWAISNGRFTPGKGQLTPQCPDYQGRTHSSCRLPEQHLLMSVRCMQLPLPTLPRRPHASRGGGPRLWEEPERGGRGRKQVDGQGT